MAGTQVLHVQMTGLPFESDGSSFGKQQAGSKNELRQSINRPDNGYDLCVVPYDQTEAIFEHRSSGKLQKLRIAEYVREELLKNMWTLEQTAPDGNAPKADDGAAYAARVKRWDAEQKQKALAQEKRERRNKVKQRES